MAVCDERIGATAERADQFALRCGTCEVPLTSQPECDDGDTFCCAGCVAGGPCICIGDATADEHRAAQWAWRSAPPAGRSTCG